jgi:hypothetical protein
MEGDQQELPMLAGKSKDELPFLMLPPVKARFTSVLTKVEMNRGRRPV